MKKLLWVLILLLLTLTAWAEDADTFAECFYAVKVTLPATLEIIPEGCFNLIEAEIDFPNGNPRYS